MQNSILILVLLLGGSSRIRGYCQKGMGSSWNNKKCRVCGCYALYFMMVNRSAKAA